MDMKKDPLKSVIDEQLKKTEDSPEKDAKTPAKEPAAMASAMTKAPEATSTASTAPVASTVVKEIGEAKKTEKPAFAQMQKSEENIQPRAAYVSKPQPKKEPDIIKGMDKLEEKITRNMEQFKNVKEKIRETDEEIEDIKLKKRRETIGDKVKKAALFAPKICVEANVCRFPKALCKGCGKMVEVWKSAGKTGMKVIGEIANKCTDSLSTGMRLPILRMKINKNFKNLGDKAYQMYLNGEKDVLKNGKIKKIIEEVKGYENQIEDLEAHLTDLNEQPTVQKQNA